MNTPPPLARLPDHADVLGWAAQVLLEAHRSRLPDLSHLTLILPTPAASASLRRALLREARTPLLGPTITTLEGFAQRGAHALPLSALDCQLLLAGMLPAYVEFFGAQDHWALATDLFTLFEELSACSPELAQDEAGFRARIERGYGGLSLSQISREAGAIHVLWRAYLQDTRGRSPAVSYLQNLKNALASLNADEQVALIGFDQLSPGELSLLKPMLDSGRLHIWLQGPQQGRGQQAGVSLAQALGAATVIDVPASETTTALQVAFAEDDLPLSARRYPSGKSAPMRSVCAQHTEHEARIVDLAIREALLKGTRDIAVVTQDRRLARRLRALLERAGIPLRDEVGWALSTSSAAASLSHWLDCCEQNFPYRALLALLKSSFYGLEEPRDLQTLEAVIYREQVASGLERLKKLPDAPRAMLASLEQAMRLMISPNAPARSGAHWSAALLRSLQALPLWKRWQKDEAGKSLMSALEDLHAALTRQSVSCNWSEFRKLLGSQLERLTFLSNAQDNPVRLLTLQQAQGLRCEFLILAGANAAQFPGKIPVRAVFNHSVRSELGLPHWTTQLDVELSRFRSLLHAAPDLLISYAPEANQESTRACPWVQWLETLGLAQQDTALSLRANSADCEITAAETILAAPVAIPQPHSVPALLPASFSASAHQSLVDCPYQFFARRCLGLYRIDEPDRPLDASDYGKRVHLILQAFHDRMAGLPAPFSEAVSAANRELAAQKMQEIADAVFAPDLRSRAMAKVWSAQFRRVIPNLIGWMLERQPDWPVVAVEQKRKRTLSAQLQVHGTLDRLETNARGEQCVVDYKTGFTPRNDDLDIGESVQGVHYAMLADECVRVEYLSLNPKNRSPKLLEAENLQDVRAHVADRLIDLHEKLSAGTAMPANGSQKTCDVCDYTGVCRKGGWHD